MGWPYTRTPTSIAENAAFGRAGEMPPLAPLGQNRLPPLQVHVCSSRRVSKIDAVTFFWVLIIDLGLFRDMRTLNSPDMVK